MRRRYRRPSTGASRYRRNRAILLASDDVCGICGHPGARTADHIIQPKIWARLFPDNPQGVDDLANLRPAHGTMAPGQPPNPCMQCGGRLCNQSRGSRLPASRPQSRRW